MNLKIKAALVTSGYLAGLFVIFYFFTLLSSMFTIDQIVSVIGWSIIAALVYGSVNGIYQLVLSRLEHQRLLEIDKQ